MTKTIGIGVSALLALALLGGCSINAAAGAIAGAGGALATENLRTMTDEQLDSAIEVSGVIAGLRPVVDASEEFHALALFERAMRSEAGGE